MSHAVQVLEEHLKHAMAAQGDGSAKAIHDSVVRAALGMLPVHLLPVHLLQR